MTLSVKNIFIASILIYSFLSIGFGLELDESESEPSTLKDKRFEIQKVGGLGGVEKAHMISGSGGLSVGQIHANDIAKANAEWYAQGKQYYVPQLDPSKGPTFMPGQTPGNMPPQGGYPQQPQGGYPQQQPQPQWG